MSYITIRAPFNKKSIQSPEELWANFIEYTAHSDSNKLIEAKIFNGKNGIVHGDLEKIRPYTLNGFCNFVGIHPGTWSRWKRLEETKEDESGSTFFLDVMLQIESIIYDHQYQGAVLDVFNASIVSRKLGLADKTELTGKDGGPIQTEDAVERDAADFLSQLARLSASSGADEVPGDSDS